MLSQCGVGFGGEGRKCCPANKQKRSSCDVWEHHPGKAPSGLQAGTSQPGTLHSSSFMISFCPSTNPQPEDLCGFQDRWGRESLHSSRVPPCAGTQTQRERCRQHRAALGQLQQGTWPWLSLDRSSWQHGQHPAPLGSALEVSDLDLPPEMSLPCWNCW